MAGRHGVGEVSVEGDWGGGVEGEACVCISGAFLLSFFLFSLAMCPGVHVLCFFREVYLSIFRSVRLPYVFPLTLHQNQLQPRQFSKKKQDNPFN